MDEKSRVIRLFIADDHAIFRDVLKKLLGTDPELLVIGEASDGEEVLKAAESLHPDILLLDWRMPKRSGKEVLHSLSASCSSIRTIVLTAEFQREQIPEAFGIGARGLVLKDSCAQVLFQSLRAVMNGRYWIGDRSLENLDGSLEWYQDMASGRIRPKNYGLTRRELEIVAAVVSGFTNREIASQFSISVQTVKHHITSIFDKVGVYTRLELALFAIHHHLTDDSSF